MKAHRREAKNCALIECVQVAAEKAGWPIRDEFKQASSMVGGGGERAKIPHTVTDEDGKIGDRRAGRTRAGRRGPLRRQLHKSRLQCLYATVFICAAAGHAACGPTIGYSHPAAAPAYQPPPAHRPRHRPPHHHHRTHCTASEDSPSVCDVRQPARLQPVCIQFRFQEALKS